MQITENIRKKPKQDRAEKTIEFISEAAIQLLDTSKNPNFTTNHIAERAGVSVGTLYRYFPDKGTILRYLVRREINNNRYRAFSVVANSQACDAESLAHELFEFEEGEFEGRRKVVFQIGSLIGNDTELQQDIRNVRLEVLRRLHEKIMTLQPTTTPALSDAELGAVIDASFTAIRSLAASSSNTVNIETRKKLVLSLLGALSD